MRSATAVSSTIVVLIVVRVAVAAVDYNSRAESFCRQGNAYKRNPALLITSIVTFRVVISDVLCTHTSIYTNIIYIYIRARCFI